MPTLGEQLKALRVKKGMTQEQLAQKLNTTKAAISRYEKDQRQPRLEQITEMAKLLEAGPDDLYYLFLGSPEFIDEKGEYATRMNAMSKWVETITEQPITDDSSDDLDNGQDIFTSGQTFYGGNMVVQKVTSNSDGTTQVTFSIHPDGMQLDQLVLLLEYLKINNLAGDGILELTNFVKAACDSAKKEK